MLLRTVAPLAALAALATACATAPTPTPPHSEAPVIEAPRYLVERPTFFTDGFIDDDAFRRWAAEVALPAISEDGAVVALGRAREDGARGNPAFEVSIVRVSDGEVLSYALIVDPDEVDAQRGDPSFAETVRERVDAANDALAAYRWAGKGQRLEDLSSIGMDNAPGRPFQGPLGLAMGGLTIVFEEPHLSVSLAGRTLVDADYPDWTQPPTNYCDPADDPEGESCVCENPVTLRGGRVDLERGVLLLDIGYIGTDLCWEPDSWTAVIALPKDLSKNQ